MKDSGNVFHCLGFSSCLAHSSQQKGLIKLSVDPKKMAYLQLSTMLLSNFIGSLPAHLDEIAPRKAFRARHQDCHC